MSEWNDDYLVFNDSIITGSTGSPRFSTIVTESGIDEIARAFRGRPLWYLDLSNLLLNEAQYDELLTFQLNVAGMLNPFLVRNVRNCVFENATGAPADLGEGDGDATTFQLIKSRSIQGRDAIIETVRFPNYNYPALQQLNSTDWDVLPELQIWTGAAAATTTASLTEVSTLDMEVDRNTGIVTLDVAPAEGTHVYATGGFYTKMRATVDEIPVSLIAGLFQVSSNVGFREVNSG